MTGRTSSSVATTGTSALNVLPTVSAAPSRTSPSVVPTNPPASTPPVSSTNPVTSDRLGTSVGSTVSNGTSVTVSSTAALISALNSAHAGETILLASGTYVGLNISGINTPGNVTIKSASSTSPAVLNGLNVTNSSGITFSGLELSSVGITKYAYAFTVSNSSNLTFTGLNVHGSMDNNPGDDIGALYIHGSNNISVTNSQFQQAASGITELNNSNITISGNSFHNIETDGIDNGGSSNVSILNNTFTNFQPATSSAHPDAIQFWTTNTTASAHNITVSGNTISVGSGGQTQGIFMSDQVGDLPYQNVTISNNTITGELYNSISVTHADGLAITGNNVTASTSTTVNAENSPSTGTATLAWIGVADSTSVSLGDNDSSGYKLSDNTGLVQPVVNKLNGVAQMAVMDSSSSATLGILSDTLVLTGTSKLSGTASTVAGTTVIGNNAGDRLYDNGPGSQTLIGGAGDDVLIARYGSDTLTGRAGNNSFNISTTVQKVTITDFGHAGSDNYLNLSGFENAGMTPIVTASGNNTVVSFSGSASTITLLGVHPNELVHSNGGFNS